jgi:hypothetical protein
VAVSTRRASGARLAVWATSRCPGGISPGASASQVSCTPSMTPGRRAVPRAGPWASAGTPSRASRDGSRSALWAADTPASETSPPTPSPAWRSSPVPQHVTVAPAPIEDVAAIPVQVDPHLWTLNERWAGGTSGAAPAGTLLRQALVDDPQAPLRLTSVTSQLDVRAVVSPTFYRPRAYEAQYRLSVRVESSATARQVWLEGRGERLSLASAARTTQGAITQAVRALYRHLSAVGDTRTSQGRVRGP